MKLIIISYVWGVLLIHENILTVSILKQVDYYMTKFYMIFILFGLHSVAFIQKL